jgi:hypothetical protein
MKSLISLVFPAVKAILAVCTFLIGIGWGAYAAITLMVKAEAGAIREEVKNYRQIDMSHIDSRLNRIDAKLDVLIKEKK